MAHLCSKIICKTNIFLNYSFYFFFPKQKIESPNDRLYSKKINSILQIKVNNRLVIGLCNLRSEVGLVLLFLRKFLNNLKKNTIGKIRPK